jgi:hypothetical protein
MLSVIFCRLVVVFEEQKTGGGVIKRARIKHRKQTSIPLTHFKSLSKSLSEVNQANISLVKLDKLLK